MQSYDIRQSFLDFFANHGHHIVRSSSLMPDAPNLLFTNAGMNQFIPFFLGTEKPSYKRIADTQKCIRAGGKHNDLDDVGFDTYHHTFFEMLGNWSFGNYFKEEAITMAWELLTSVWKFPKERLYATVYSPADGEPSCFDQEAYDIWKNIFIKNGLDPEIHIISGSRKDNFWMMGDTGPCGPCSEIHMDLTPDGKTNGTLVNTGNPWCIELWNLVFMQFNARPDGTFEPLLEKHVDTGIGFERVVGIISKTKNFSDFSSLPSNYDSDLFIDIFSAIEKMSNKKYNGTIPSCRQSMSDIEQSDFRFRAIADHIRTLTFAIADRIYPSNEGRGYVLRRILRRAVLFGHLLGLPQGFFADLSKTVIQKMHNVFPELKEQEDTIKHVIEREETSFSKTLDRGINIFNDICKKSNDIIQGNDIFLLYDTYGFPVDLIQLLSAERNIQIDLPGFERAMESQRTKARNAQKKSLIEVNNGNTTPTTFVGYDINHIENVPATMLSIIHNEKKLFVICDKTPFYAESGGQIGDIGTINIDGKIFEITDVKKDNNGCFLHEIDNNDILCDAPTHVTLSVNKQHRMNVTRNHSATHLLQCALRNIIGQHIKQAGSLVTAEQLRFDFNAFSAPTQSELLAVERWVEQQILSCQNSSIYETSRDNIPEECLANFGEKYGDIVRVVELGQNSKELCCGCHVNNTSEIASFKIISSSAVAAGIRRIEAITGQAAYEYARSNNTSVEQICNLLSCNHDNLVEQTRSVVEKNKSMERTIKEIRQSRICGISNDIVKSYQPATPNTYIEQTINDVTPDELRILACDIINNIHDGTVILSTQNDKKCHVVVCCSESAIANGRHAGNIVKEITSKHGGSGGGKPSFAMGGYSL